MDGDDLSDRAKSIISIVVGAILIAIGIVQWVHGQVWIVGRGGPGVFSASVTDGWWLLAIELFFGVVGVILGIAGLITDNFPPSWSG